MLKRQGIKYLVGEWGVNQKKIVLLQIVLQGNDVSNGQNIGGEFPIASRILSKDSD